MAKQAFKMFMGVTCDIANFDADGKAFSLILNENPLSDFVVLPL